MTTFIVIWLSVNYSCPWGLGYAPTLVKELACSKRATLEERRYPAEDQARRKLLEIGPREDVAIWKAEGSPQRLTPVWLPHLSH